MMGVPGNFFNIAFLVSLVLQSTTVGLVARWLKIGDGAAAPSAAGRLIVSPAGRA